MRKVYVNGLDKTMEVYAIVIDDAATNFLIKSGIYETRMNPYYLAKIFEARIEYVADELEKYRNVTTFLPGYYWISDSRDWHYINSNDVTLKRLKQETVY